MKTEQLTAITEKFFDHTKDITSSSVPFDEQVRVMCEQNMCGQLGKCWTCPPAVGSLETLHAGLSLFTRFMIFDKVYQLEDSYDWEGMVESQKDFTARVVAAKKEIRPLLEESDPDFLILGAGSCSLCKTCSYLSQEPCRNPDDAVTSVEAFGIDAMTMMGQNNLKYNNGANTVTYIGGIFYKG